VAETLATVFGLDMTGTWAAADSYFSRVLKPRVLETVCA